jgi:hypothetical protein
VVSSSPGERRRYTVVMDLWRAPGEDVENFEGVEGPDAMELVDEARFNLDSASRANEAVYWLGQRGWIHYGAYDALVLDRSELTRDELARHLLLAGLQRQVVEEYDDPTSHRPSRLVHLNPETMQVEEWPEQQSLGHDIEHCPLCLRGFGDNDSPPEPDSVLQEAEMILAAARFRDTVRRTGLRLPEVMALFYGYSQVRQLTQEELYSLIEQYREYREDLERRGVIDE